MILTPLLETIATLRRWCRALVAGWDRWITTAAELHGTQTDPSYPLSTEQCSTPTPAGPDPGSATTEHTPPPPPAGGTSPTDGGHYPSHHPPAPRPGRATTYPSQL